MPRLTRLQMLALLPFMVALWGLMGMLLGDHDKFASWVTPYLLGVAGASLAITLSAFIPSLGNGLKRFFENPFLAFGILIGLWAAWGWGLWATRIDRLPPLESYLPFSLLWVWPIVAYLLASSDSAKHRMTLLVKMVLQVVVTVGIVLVMLEVLLRMVATRLPDEMVNRSVYLRGQVESSEDLVLMPPQAPVRVYRSAGQTSNYTLYNTDGDLYRYSCMQPPATKEALYEVNITYNEHGFRQTTDGPARLVVVGDSFTMAAWTAEPYWMNIVPDVLAMGISGSGSLEQAMLLEAFGPERQPEVVVMAFFEGNDMQDTWGFSQEVERYQQEVSLTLLQRYGRFRPLRFFSAYAAGLWAIDQIDVLEEAVYGACPYPITDSYGNTMGYYDSYVSMSTVETNVLATSAIFERTTESIQRAADQARAMNAEFVLMFIPTTFHAHWQGLVEAGELETFSQHIHAFEITPEGFTNQSGVSSDQIAARLTANIDNQRTLLGQWAEEQGMLFLDLTAPLQALAAEGQTAYSDNDTHWSNEGHVAVRQLLQQFLAEHDLLGQ